MIGQDGVQLNGKFYRAYCDKDGKCRFFNIPSGQYKLYSHPVGNGQPELIIRGVHVQSDKKIVYDMAWFLFFLVTLFWFSGNLIA